TEQEALRHPRHAQPEGGRAPRDQWLRAPHQLGCDQARLDRAGGNAGGGEAVRLFALLGLAAALAAIASPAAVPREKVDVEAGRRALASRALEFPVKGYEATLRDNFDERRGDHVHEALDIMAPRGTPVVAVDDGR